MRAQKVSRAAEFELRARNMGITEEWSVEEKIKIWEGMYVAEQDGKSVDVSILYSLIFRD